MLLGGSQADSGRTFTHGFFHEGVNSTQFKASNNYFLRILPAFDTSKMGTPDFETSYLPYRSKELPEDYKTKTPGFTPWFYVVQAYTWFGKGNQTFISPLSTAQPGQRAGVDPIRDIRNYCEKSDDPQIRELTVDKSFKERAPAPTTRIFGLVNILLMTDINTKRTQNQVGIFTNAAITDLKHKLSMRAGRNDEVISADWEDFIYGDITHPVEGLAVTVKETSPEGAESIRFAGAHFSDASGRLDGHQKWDISATDALKNRYNIADDSEVTKVWSYDEVLEYVVQDGVIPYNVIEAACSPFAENGIPTPAATVSVGSNHSLPTQVKEAVTPEPVATPAPTPEPVAVAASPEPVSAPEPVPAPTPAATETASTETEKSDPLTPEERTRYDALAEMFKNDPQSVPATDLPEYFDLCAKIGVYPSK